MTRLGGWGWRLRAVVIWVLPFFAIATLMGLLVTFAIVSINSTNQRDAQKETLREVKEATLINRQLIERGNPCVAGDDPNSEACIAQQLSDARLADALAAVQAQHDEQAKQVDDAVARLVELQERQHGNSVTPRVPSTIPKRPTPRITASGPTTTATPTTVTPSPAPSTTPPPTTTTTCPKRGKSDRCR